MIVFRLLSVLAMMATIFMPVFATAFDLKPVTAKEVAEKLDRLTVLDARPLARWEKGHLPGALSFSWENYTRTDKDGVKYRILPPDQLAKTLGSMGIGQNDGILVYGDADSSWGGEGWVVWMLSWLGHKGTIYFLDGGIQSWQKRGEALSTSQWAKRKPVVYAVNMNPRVNASHAQLRTDPSRITLIDTRNYLTEWLPGHLPGAVHIPWEKFYQGPERRIVGHKALNDLLKKVGVDGKKPLVFYCTGGIRSGFAWMVAVMNGYPAAMNFEGGTEEWNRFNP